MKTSISLGFATLALTALLTSGCVASGAPDDMSDESTEVAASALDQVAVDTGYITFDGGVPVGGYASVKLFPDGRFQFSGHFHCSGATSYNVGLVYLIKGNSGSLLELSKQGRCHGTFESGSRDFDWNDAGTNQAIVANWPDLTNWVTPSWSAKADMDLGSIFNTIREGIGTVTTIVAVVGPLL